MDCSFGSKQFRTTVATFNSGTRSLQHGSKGRDQKASVGWSEVICTHSGAASFLVL